MIVIVDYKAGNLTSVKLALDTIGVQGEITTDAETILAAERVIFPGVGSFGSAMRSLENLGLDNCLKTVVERGTPFLGICLGTQIILERSEEDGSVEGLGLIPGPIRLFRPFATTKKSGLGLGLYQCRSIVETHGGEIQVESRVGVGTTFRILLRGAASTAPTVTRAVAGLNPLAEGDEP